MDLATLGLRVDGDGYIRTIDSANRSTERLLRSGGAAERMVGNLRRAFLQFAGAASIGAFLAMVVHNTEEAQYAQAQLAAAVTSTGGAAGFTVRQLQDMASELQKITTFDDEAIQGAQALLLTFTNIRGDVFKDATLAVANLAQRMGGDLRGASIQVGKALQDPIRGILALRRAGVSFTEDQQTLIRSLVESGRVVEAQRVVLGELQKEFGGAASAARNTLGGALKGLAHDFGDLLEVSTDGTRGIVGLINKVDRGLLFLKDHLPQVQAAAGALFIAIGVGVGVYVALTAAIKAAATWQAILTAVETIRAFISLARAVRGVADAAALLALVGEGAVGALAAIAAMAAGWFAYKKLIQGLNAESDRQDEKLRGLLGTIEPLSHATHELSDAEKQRLEQMRQTRYANEDMVREAQQGLALAALQGDALERQRIAYDAVNKEIAARRTQQGALLTETLAAIEAEKQLRLQAVGVAASTQRASEKLKEQAQVLKEFSDRMQSAFADTFNSILDGGVKTFGQLFASIRSMFFRMLSEMLAAATMKRLGASLAGSLAGIFGMAGHATATSPTPSTSGAATPITLAGISATAQKSLVADMAKYLGPAIGGFIIGGMIGSLTSNRGLGTLGGAVAGAGAGAAIGSIVPGVGTIVGGAVGGIAGAIGGFLGASKKRSEEEKARADLLARNNARLAELREALNGELLRGQNLARALQATTAYQGKSKDDLTRTANKYGLTLGQLEMISQRVGIALYDNAGKIVPGALKQLHDALELTIRSVTRFGNDLDDTKARQDAYNKLFNVKDTPAQRLRDSQALLEKMAPELLKAVGGANLDLSSDAGRKAFLASLQDIFRMIDSGQLTPELLGAFTDKNQLIDAILSAKDGLDAFSKSLSNVTTDFPKAMDLLLFEQRHGTQFKASTGTPLNPSAPRDTGGGFVVHGDLIVQTSKDESGEAFIQKLERAAVNRARRGNITRIPGLKVPS